MYDYIRIASQREAHIGRRRFCSLSVAALASGGGRVSAAPSPTSGLIANPLETFVRMRSGEAGGLGYWPYAGTIFGRLIDRPAVPLFNVVGIGIGGFVKEPDGSFSHFNNEVGYFTELVSGAQLHMWTNPLNGARCEILSYKSRQESVFRPDMTIAIASPGVPGVKMEGYGVVGGPKVQGGSLWMSEDLFVKIIRPSSPAIIGSSLASFRIDISDLKRPKSEMVPAQLYYETLGSWRRDMQMGDTPGILSWRMTAEKASSPATLAPDVQKWIERDYPGFFETSAAAKPRYF
jgi:hypothetical protein